MSDVPRESNHVSQIFLANTRPFVWLIESDGNDNLAYVAREPDYIQQGIIDQESLRRATARIEKWLSIKRGRPGEEIEPPADAFTGKVDMSASVS